MGVDNFVPDLKDTLNASLEQRPSLGEVWVSPHRKRSSDFTFRDIMLFCVMRLSPCFEAASIVSLKNSQTNLWNNVSVGYDLS